MMAVPSALLFGFDPTPGIVSVSADKSGLAHVWRRQGEVVTCQTHRFLNWFVARELAILADYPYRKLSLEEFRSGPTEPGELGVVELDGQAPFRYLVASDRMAEIEAAILALHNKQTGLQARSLASLRRQVYWRPPAEQFLIATGRTYFKGMAFHEVRRLQFDLETSGLDERRDHIFMINISDSAGFHVCLDTGSIDEAELIRRFVEVVRARDPDVLENHNLFAFDIPFLVHRARALGVPLPLGRDGSAFVTSVDSFRVGAHQESFARYSLVGREIVDTMQAVRRYGAVARDLGSHGLKQVARYFGFARQDREYVAGGEIWSTFLDDPERVRRYGASDVDEVNQLSEVLTPVYFAVATMVPRAYERVATTPAGAGLLEPLLVRQYLAEGQALPAWQADGRPQLEADAHLVATGIVPHVVKMGLSGLYTSLMQAANLGPRKDRLGVFGRLVAAFAELRRPVPQEAAQASTGSAALQSAVELLQEACFPSLAAGSALFADHELAVEVSRRGREQIGLVLSELEKLGAVPIQADARVVYFGVAAGWGRREELELVQKLNGVLPSGMRAEVLGRYRRMYSYAERNFALLPYEGSLKLTGNLLRSSWHEHYGQSFLGAALEYLLADDLQSVRRLYLDTIARLRARQFPAEEICSLAILDKAPESYRQSGHQEEPYELLLASGRADWRKGQRVRFYRSSSGRKRLLEDYAGDYDAEHYVRRLRSTYAQRLAKAVSSEDLEALLADGPTLFEPDFSQWGSGQPRAVIGQQSAVGNH